MVARAGGRGSSRRSSEALERRAPCREWAESLALPGSVILLAVARAEGSTIARPVARAGGRGSSRRSSEALERRAPCREWAESLALPGSVREAQSVGRNTIARRCTGIPDPKWFMIGRSERGLAYGVFVGIRAPMLFPKIQGSPPSGSARQIFTALPCSCKIEG